MTKVDFNNKKVDFFSINSFVKKSNLNHSSVLEQAFQQEFTFKFYKFYQK